MNEGLIPNRYAKALFKYAIDEGVAERVYGEMRQLSMSFASEEALAATIDNPFLAIADREKLLLTASGAKQGGCFDKFILLVIKHNRENFMREIALAYEKIYREANKIALVDIITASKLSDEQVSKIIEVVEKQLKDKKLETNVSVDPDLLGGFIVKVDSMVLDTSIKNELKKLRLKLLSNKER